MHMRLIFRNPEDSAIGSQNFRKDNHRLIEHRLYQSAFLYVLPRKDQELYPQARTANRHRWVGRVDQGERDSPL